jgi:pseudo-response regulator 7
MQSSWTKHAVEVDSLHPMSPSDQLADPPDSTCAQVIHPKAENYCDGWLPIAAQKECEGKKNISHIFTSVPFTRKLTRRKES